MTTPLKVDAASRPGGWGAPLSCRVPRPDAAVRLVCFAHSGGGPEAFRTWPAGLGGDVEVWTATLPGRAGRAREPFARDWDALTAELAAHLDEHVPGRYALFGHSLGAVVAFETARRLAAAGRPPAHLVVSARSAPDTTERLVVPPGDGELVDMITTRYGGIPDAVRRAPELLEFYLPVLRADLELAAGYVHRPGPPLEVPVTAVAGDRDAAVPSGELTGWIRQTAREFDAHRLPGGHFYLREQEDVLLRLIHRRLVG